MALLTGRGRDRAGVADEAADVLALGDQRLQYSFRFVGEIGEDVVLARQHRDHLVGLLKRRIGALKGRVQALAVCVQPRAQPGDDQPEALLLGQAGDVLNQVEADRGCRVLYRKYVLALVGARRDCLERWRR